MTEPFCYLSGEKPEKGDTVRCEKPGFDNPIGLGKKYVVRGIHIEGLVLITADNNTVQEYSSIRFNLVARAKQEEDGYPTDEEAFCYRNGEKPETGDTVCCIDKVKNARLSVGKRYVVEEVRSKTWIVVESDNNERYAYRPSRFVLVSRVERQSKPLDTFADTFVYATHVDHNKRQMKATEDANTAGLLPTKNKKTGSMYINEDEFDIALKAAGLDFLETTEGGYYFIVADDKVDYDCRKVVTRKKKDTEEATTIIEWTGWPLTKGGYKQQSQMFKPGVWYSVQEDKSGERIVAHLPDRVTALKTESIEKAKEICEAHARFAILAKELDVT